MAPRSAPSDPTDRTAASFGRLVAVRLFAFALLIGVTSLFIDYPGLIRQASESATPIDLTALPIDVSALGPGATVGERIVTGDGAVRELAATVIGASGAALAGGVTARFYDAEGNEIGQQKATLSPNADGSRALRLVFTRDVRVARAVVEAAR